MSNNEAQNNQEPITNETLGKESKDSENVTKVNEVPTDTEKNIRIPPSNPTNNTGNISSINLSEGTSQKISKIKKNHRVFFQPFTGCSHRNSCRV